MARTMTDGSASLAGLVDGHSNLLRFRTPNTCRFSDLQGDQIQSVCAVEKRTVTICPTCFGFRDRSVFASMKSKRIK